MLDHSRGFAWGTRSALAFVLLVFSSCVSNAVAADPPLVVFLVRHAEKVDNSRDPELSTAGKTRAAQLARLLRDAKIEHIHSSDYARTRSTAQPLAKQLRQTVKLYNPRDLASVVSSLKQAGGRHLVVGHSNTTPMLVKMLGGEPGRPIVEATEYDRLYCVTIHGEQTTTVLLRYGQPGKTP